jgi:hypothetical protein
LAGISEQPQTVTLRLKGGALQKIALKANARVELAADGRKWTQIRI